MSGPVLPPPPAPNRSAEPTTEDHERRRIGCAVMLAVPCVALSATIGTLFVAVYRLDRPPGPHDQALLLAQCIVQVVAIIFVVVALFTRKPSRAWIRRPVVMVTVIVVALATPFVVMPWLMTKWPAPFVPLAPPILSGPTEGKGLSPTSPTSVGTPVDVSNQFELTVVTRPPTSPSNATTAVGQGRSYDVELRNTSGISISIADSVRLWLDTPSGRVPVGVCPATTEQPVQLDQQVAPKGTVRGTICFPDAAPDSAAVIVSEPVKTVNADFDRRYLATP